jgi:hypothetical protein
MSSSRERNLLPQVTERSGLPAASQRPSICLDSSSLKLLSLMLTLTPRARKPFENTLPKSQQNARFGCPRLSIRGMALCWEAGIRVIAKQFGVDPGTGQRISRPFEQPAVALRGGVNGSAAREQSLWRGRAARFRTMQPFCVVTMRRLSTRPTDKGGFGSRLGLTPPTSELLGFSCRGQRFSRPAFALFFPEISHYRRPA